MTDFLRDEVVGGVVLLVATVVALLWANIAPDTYTDLWHTQADIGSLHLDMQHWVNDGLMALFFFVVGLEIKRELVEGELADRRAAAVPVAAAVGGVVLPALVFTAIVAGGEGAAGWAIPAATDIAFAIGVLALLGDRVPQGVRIVLLSVAIVDDILAILIIALVYSDGIDVLWLAAAAGTLVVVEALRRFGVVQIAVYIALGVFAWFEVHESGVHATIAGVVLGLMTPSGDILHRLEHLLHPFTAFVVIPLFALANAGIEFGGGVLSDALSSTVTWAVVAGLVIGKLVGVTGTSRLALRAGGELPEGVEVKHLFGIGALAGIGFTVSLFIAQLAFDNPVLVDQAKIGIFLGSMASGVLGAGLFLAMARSSR